MEKPATPTDPLYTEHEAADYTRSNVGTMRNNRSKGIGPDYLKLGGRVFYAKSQLDNYIQSCVRKCG